MTIPDPLGPEDAKLVTLARSARLRAYTPGGADIAEGAAVRDTDGRTYAAATVQLADLPTSALRAAVVAAVSSGARTFEAAAVVTVDGPAGAASSHGELAALAEFGAGIPVYVAAPDGTLTAVTTT